MKHLKPIALTLFALTLFVPQASAKTEKLAELKVGDKAPTFVGVDDQDKPWDSKEKAGKKIVVVYFYPADMTPGCTKQACSYRDAVAKLKRTDVEVIGISGDAVENHRHFKNEYELNFTLLADTDGKIAKAFGVKTGKGGSIQRPIDGKEITLTRGVTASRWTFVIDKDWRIAHKDTKVNAAKDSETVLKVIEKLP
ncbi:MAG: peroxiredoxin [Planctomycetes bacterium]|nr:peroxiredoxin [Planctomycetota bacterium]